LTRVWLFAALAVFAAIIAVVQLTTPVSLALPTSVDGGGNWSCGGLPGFLFRDSNGYHGGDHNDGIYEYVTIHCRPAAMSALAGLVVAACVSVAALTALLVTVRGRRVAASI
jgi:hypothetical protein